MEQFSKCKGPEVGVCLTCLENNKEDMVARMQQSWEKGRGRELESHSHAKDFGFYSSEVGSH